MICYVFMIRCIYVFHVVMFSYKSSGGYITGSGTFIQLTMYM